MKQTIRLFALIVASVECYKLRILNLTECRFPDPPMVKNIREKWLDSIESYVHNNDLLVKGNVTLLQDLHFYASFKVIEKVREYSNPVSFNGITCRNVILKMLLQYTNVRYDPTECIMLKGNYVFKDLDIRKIERVVNFMPTHKRGSKIWYFTIYNKEGSYCCVDINVVYET